MFKKECEKRATEIYRKGRTEYEEMYDEFIDEEAKYLNEEEE